MTTAKKEQQTLVTIAPLYLNRRHAAEFLSMSESMLEALGAEHKQLKPRQLSAGRVAWLVEDLIAWGKERPVSTLLPPEGSGHGRRGKPANEVAETQA